MFLLSLFLPFPFTVAHGFLNCFPLSRLLLTMLIVSFMFVSLYASCFSFLVFSLAHLLMLRLSACSVGCFPMPSPWAHLACMFRFGRLRPGPPIDREFCCICVNIRLMGTQRCTTVSAGEGGSSTSLGPHHLPPWPSLVHLVFVCQRCFRLGFFGGFSPSVCVGSNVMFHVCVSKVYCFRFSRRFFSCTFPFRRFLSCALVQKF